MTLSEQFQNPMKNRRKRQYRCLQHKILETPLNRFGEVHFVKYLLLSHTLL